MVKGQLTTAGYNIATSSFPSVRGAVASWLVSSTPDQAVDYETGSLELPDL